MSNAKLKHSRPFAAMHDATEDKPGIDSLKVSECIESLCTNGCAAVNATIKLLERHEPVPQIRHLNVAEREAVLLELKTVMAVYNARGACKLRI